MIDGGVEWKRIKNVDAWLLQCCSVVVQAARVPVRPGPGGRLVRPATYTFGFERISDQQHTSTEHTARFKRSQQQSQCPPVSSSSATMASAKRRSCMLSFQKHSVLK